MRLFTALILVLFMRPASAEWSDDQVAMEVAGQLMLAADWNQTLQIAGDPEHYYEMNPLLGEHPSKAEVNRHFVAYAATHLLISSLLEHPWRERWQRVTFAVELGFVAHNYSIGIGVKF